MSLEGGGFWERGDRGEEDVPPLCHLLAFIHFSLVHSDVEGKKAVQKHLKQGAQLLWVGPRCLQRDGQVSGRPSSVPFARSGFGSISE